MKNIKKSWLVIGGIVVFIFVIIISPSSKIEEVKTNNSIKEDINTAIKDVKIPKITEEETIVAKQKIIIQTNPQYKYYSVTKVVDGDTLKININGTNTTLRLIGLDTPETVDPRKPVQCFGKEASNKAKELLSGRKVRIEKDSTQGKLDRYGRTLAYVYREDGLFYNKYMIEKGYAHEYTYNIPYKYQTEFKNAQKVAQTNLLGLWSPNTCNGDTASITTTKTPVIIQTTQLTGEYYTSSYYSSKYYYPKSCSGWEGLSKKYLKSFNSLKELLKVYPTKILSSQCN